MTQTQFDARVKAIRAASTARGFRVPRDTSPGQTSLAVDREVYEFVRAHADRNRTSLRAALRTIMEPLMREDP